MALQSALTNDQLTAIRSGKYQALQFVCVVPSSVVVQFNPASAPTTSVYAEITPDTPLSGDMADIQQGQTVIYSTTADYQATEVFRTRVRKVSGTATLYVGENSQQLTTSDYVTVLNTYEVQEKLRKSETYADWDITFRKLLPIESDLPSAVVLSNGVTAYSPTANPQEMDNSATSTFTHTWESSNSNDTLDSGGTTNNPTFTLEAGSFRWIRYTFTDSNGNANFRVIPVWTVPKNYDNPYVVTGFVGESGDIADIAFDAELGWSATVTAWDGIEDLINKTYTVIASDEWYNDTRQSIRTNIDFVGFLQNENTGTRGDETIGRLSETTFTVEGFGAQLARQNIAPIRITRTASTPTAWNQIQNPTPARMLTYHLTEGSTLFHLCSMTIPSDDTDFIGDDLSITNGKAYDDIRFITEVINAELQFDVNGKLDLCRNLNFLDDTARDAAADAATLSPADVLDYAIEYDYSRTTSQLTMTGGAYDSSADEYDLYEAIAPAVARLGEGDPLEVSNQVLTTDSTAAEALSEISERSANFFAYNNPTPTLRATLKDEWHFIVPDIGSWWKFDIVLTDTARGRVFSTDDRWQCVERTVGTNNETGRRTVTATFRHETQSTGAIIRARQIVNDPAADIIYFPPVLPPFTGGDLSLTDGEWWDSMDVASAPSDPNPVDPDCENTGFRVQDGFHETDRTASNNEYVGITVRGSGRIDRAQYSYIDYDFADGANGFTATNGSLAGGYFDGTELDPDPDSISIRSMTLAKALGGTYRVCGIGMKFTSRYDCGTPSLSVQAYNGGVNVAGGSLSPSGSRDEEFRTWSFATKLDGVETDEVRVHVGSQLCNGQDAIARVYRVRVWIAENSAIHETPSDIAPQGIVASGTSDAAWWDDTPAEETYGDAFYYSDDNWATATPHSDGFGLLVEGFSPLSIPPFDPSHQYALDPLQVNSGPVDFTYEPEFGTSGLTNWSLQLSVCFLGSNP